MFTTNQTIRKFIAALPLLGIAIVSTSWIDPYGHGAAVLGDNIPPTVSDTVPRRSLDHHLSEIRRSKKQLRQDLDSKNWNRIEAEMESALDRINTDKIEMDVKKALEGLDIQQEALSKQDFRKQMQLDKLEEQLKRAEREIRRQLEDRDWEQEMRVAQESMRRAKDEMARINSDEFRADMDELREELQRQQLHLGDQLKSAKKNLKDQKINLRETLEEAQKGIDKAEKELEGYKEMTEKMIKAKLIKDPHNYEIEFRKGRLYIDGIEQSEATSKEYQRYFIHENNRITNRNDEWNMQTGSIID